MEGTLRLQEHQYGPSFAMRRHFVKRDAPKGVLTYFEVGTGKTFAALHAARTFIDWHPNGRVYIITTRANIESTWSRDWRVYSAALNRQQPGASSRFTRALDWGTRDAIFKLKMPTNRPILIIVDEAHLVRNMNSQSAPRLIDLCAQASYTILLTATPIVRTIFDANALLSYIHGEAIDWVDEDTTPTYLGQLFNKAVIYKAQDRSQFPRIHHVEKRVALGHEYELFVSLDEQVIDNLKHDLMRDHRHGERWNTTIARVAATRGLPKNPFLVNSRRVCNSDVKLQAIFDVINQDAAEGTRRMVVFSNFRDEGIDGFFLWLLTKQFRRPNKRTYAYATGMLANGIRAEVALWSNEQYAELTKWQHSEDDICKVLLISPMAREGLSLRGVRKFHLMEPSWNISDEEQAIGRAARLTSHRHLPADQQDVTVYHWIATFQGAQTSDERVAELASLRNRIIQNYLNRLRLLGHNYLTRLVQG